MIIALTGTPGTGKTAMARLVKKKLGTACNLVEIKKMAKELPFSHDKKRKTKVIDEAALRKAVARKTVPGKMNIVEGHLAHFCDADKIIVLRLEPFLLKRRLEKRRWPKSKATENVEAELTDIITQEALAEHGKRKVFEIDTSKMPKDKAAQAIISIINAKAGSKTAQRYGAGKVDFSKSHMVLAEQ